MSPRETGYDRVFPHPPPSLHGRIYLFFSLYSSAGVWLLCSAGSMAAPAGRQAGALPGKNPLELWELVGQSPPGSAQVDEASRFQDSQCLLHIPCIVHQGLVYSFYRAPAEMLHQSTNCPVHFLSIYTHISVVQPKSGGGRIISSVTVRVLKKD